MKKKIVLGFASLATAAVTALTMTGCDGKSITKEKFLKGVMASYDNYMERANIEDPDDITKIGNMRIKVKGKGKSVADTVYTYSTSSYYYADTVEQEVTEKDKASFTLKVDTKTIDGVQHLFVKYKSSAKGTYYEQKDGYYSPYVEVNYKEQTDISWEFGYYFGDYYARVNEYTTTEESEYSNTPAVYVETRQEYYVFGNQFEYNTALARVLSSYNNLLVQPYSMASDLDEVDEVEFHKSFKNYTANISYADGYLSNYGGLSVSNYKGSIVFGRKGLKSMKLNMTDESSDSKITQKVTMSVKYNSFKRAVNNPFNGYEEVPYLDTSDAFISIGF